MVVEENSNAGKIIYTNTVLTNKVIVRLMLCAYSFTILYIKTKESASSCLSVKHRVSLKTVHLQGFWSKTVYLKCFGIQLKTVYLQGPCSSRPCISRPGCIIDYFLFLQECLECGRACAIDNNWDLITNDLARSPAHCSYPRIQPDKLCIFPIRCHPAYMVSWCVHWWHSRFKVCIQISISNFKILNPPPHSK